MTDSTKSQMEDMEDISDLVAGAEVNEGDAAAPEEEPSEPEKPKYMGPDEAAQEAFQRIAGKKDEPAPASTADTPDSLAQVGVAVDDVVRHSKFGEVSTVSAGGKFQNPLGEMLTKAHVPVSFIEDKVNFNRYVYAYVPKHKAMKCKDYTPEERRAYGEYRKLYKRIPNAPSPIVQPLFTAAVRMICSGKHPINPPTDPPALLSPIGGDK